MKRTPEELTRSLVELLGDRATEDVAISLLEDIADSIPSEDWEARYNELNNSWRKRYTERFYLGDNEDAPDKGEEDNPENLTIEDIFTEKE